MLPRLLDDGLPWDYFVNTRWNYIKQKYVPQLFSNQMRTLTNKRMNQSLYGIEPNFVFQAVGPTITDTTPSRIACGAVQLKPEISRLTSNGVVFSDGTNIEADVIIFATGQ
jgi:Flavin-binding monooxygenase-like